jgi:hypothetical protein
MCASPVRHPERASFLAKAGTTGQITTAYADVWNEASVRPAVNGAEAVVNTVGTRAQIIARITHVTSPPRGDPPTTYPAGIDVMCQEQPLASKSLNHFFGAQQWPPPVPSLESRG